MNLVRTAISLCRGIIPKVSLLVLLSGFAWAQSTARSTNEESILTPISSNDTSPRNEQPRTAREQKAIPETYKSKAKYDISKIGDRGIGRGLDFYSQEQEHQLGQELANII